MAYRKGMSRERLRRRSKAAWRAVLWLVVAGVIGGIGYSSYQTGSLLARQEVVAQARQVASLQGQLTVARARADSLAGDLTQARAAMGALQQRYTADVPGGVQAEMLALVQARLADGVDQARLAQVLRDAQKLRSCDGRAVRKRFAIQQPGAAAEDPIPMLEGLILVSAATDDPAKPPVVTLAGPWTPTPVRLTGLPARQAIVLNNLQMTLMVEQSDLRGYATVSLSTCGKS
jgi:hypothetical protein